MTKKVETFINKLFKMADGYLQEYVKLPVSGVPGWSAVPLSRNMINNTYEHFRKKKEAAA